MKKREIIALSFVATLLMCCVSYVSIGAVDQNQQQSKVAVKKKPITSSRHRKGKEAKDQDVVPEEAPIENFDQYVTEFDHIAKQKAVDALVARGVNFCANNTLQKICHAFTHTQDFVEGAMYLFLLDMDGVVYAHGDQPALLWQSLWNRRDMFGNLIVQSMVKIAHAGGGLFTYEWDGAVKVSVIKKVVIDGVEFVLGCGYYPHSKEYAVIGLVKGAVALFNQYAAEKRAVVGAFSDMSYPKSPQFIFGDLYLYALDFNGEIKAQADHPGLIGSNSLHYADAKGKQYNQDIIAMLQKKDFGEGIWIDYNSKNAKKRAYAEKVKDNEGNFYFIACGYYPEVDRDKTVDLVRRGYQFMKASGVSRAQKEFDEELNNAYRFGDLGLFLYDMKGVCLANGVHNDMVGQNQLDLKDADGRYYVREFIERANAGGGWVNFKNNNSFQSTYVEKIDMGVGEFVIGSGMFPVTKPETMVLLVKSAVGYLNSHPMDKLLQRLIDRNDEFIRGDLFTYVIDIDGFCYSWGDSYKLIWQNITNWKDENGKLFIKAMIESANQGPNYLVLTMNKCKRVHYFEEVEIGEKKYIIGSGFYK